MPMNTPINCDMGEGYGLYRCGDDAGLMPLVTWANIACGFHASDPVVMRDTVRLARRHGVAVGAHPSYPDLQGFGRREMKMRRDELAAAILYQVGALKAFLDAEGMPLNYIKPHGALYGVASRDEEVAHAICDAALVFGVPLLGLAGTRHEAVYTQRGVPFIAEFYADLDYSDDAGLIITREHHARDPAEVAARVRRALAQGKATSINGREITVRAATVCVHSDTPGAVELTRAVQEACAGTSFSPQ
jgi:UPF0271 protein